MQKAWSNAEIDLLKTEWPTANKARISELFPDREYKTIKSKAYHLKIKKVPHFKNINKLSFLLEESNHAFYWIGLLMADGHFSERNEIRFTLSEKDKCQIEKFAELSGAKIKKFSNIESGGYISAPFYTISVMDANTISCLKARYRIESNKTKKPCRIDTICESRFFIPWFAGFFDGDGCVMKNNRGIANGLRIQIHSSWKENLDLISKTLDNLGIKSKSYLDTQGYAKLVIFSTKNILELCKISCEAKIPLLDRKLPFALQSLQ